MVKLAITFPATPPEKNKQSKVIQFHNKENLLEDAFKKSPDHLAHFVKMQLKLDMQQKHSRRYSPEIKSLTISLYHASGKAYHLLSESSLKYQQKLPYHE